MTDISKLKTNNVDFSKLPKPVLGAHPEWEKLYDFAWRLAANSIRESGKRRYVDIAWDPTRNFQWVWDTCFVTLFCRYAAGEIPGIESLDNFYDLQSEEGYISMTYDMDTGKEAFPDRINPPLFAWVEWEHYRTTGDSSRFEKVVPAIEKHMDWIDANRRTIEHAARRVFLDDKVIDHKDKASYRLYYFKDCGSSGMDDSPRTPRRPEAGQFFDWIDLSSQMALSFRRLADMNSVLGRKERVQYWTGRAEELGKLVNEELWCEATRFYHDRSIPTNFVAHKTAAGFWPILADICPDDRLDSLVEHLLDENEFNKSCPVPTLSADDLNYSPEGRYWLGGVWAPTNYMISRGLMLADKNDIAHDIAVKYIDALARTYASFEPHTLWESYSPERDTPGLAAYSSLFTRPNFVGWSAIGPIAMLIENVLGIDLDMHRREIRWEIRLTEEHGMKNLPLGKDGTVDLVCAERPVADSKARVTLRSDVAFSVTIRRGEALKTIDLNPGSEIVDEV